MENKLQLWEIVKAVTTGAYVCGDTFINERGEIIYVDIHHNLVMTNNKLNTSNEWSYVEDEK